MRLPLIRMGSGFVTLALFAGAPAVAVEADVLPSFTADAMAQAASPQAIAEYRRKLREYEQVRAAFEEEAGAYWSAISEKRKGRNAKRRERQTIALDDYVLTQPPVYNGPKRPVNPEPEEEKPPRERKPVQQRPEGRGKAGAGEKKPPARAKADSGGRRFPQSCRGQFPVRAAAA